MTYRILILIVLSLIYTAKSFAKMQMLPIENTGFKYTFNDKTNPFPDFKKSALNVSVAGGIGFENILLGTASNGLPINLSSGGGHSIGLGYTYYLNRNFDFTFKFSYQSSILSQFIAYSWGSFNRKILEITPEYNIPLGNTGLNSLKIGPGFGYYLFPVMHLYSRQPVPFNDKLSYNSTIGYHFSLIYENYFTKKSSLHFGMKYYKVNYTSLNFYSTYSKLQKPDGSGLDFIFGYSFHF